MYTEYTIKVDEVVKSAANVKPGAHLPWFVLGVKQNCQIRGLYPMWLPVSEKHSQLDNSIFFS